MVSTELANFSELGMVSTELAPLPKAPPQLLLQGIWKFRSDS